MTTESTEWIEEYQHTEDLNRKYQLLRKEMTRLRTEAGGADRFDRDDVAETVRSLDQDLDDLDGHLLVFAANDFGLPMAYRPESLSREHQDEVRQAVLSRKYETDHDLNSVREQLLETHPRIHKVLVASHSEGQIRYHLPGGVRETTNFLTVREAVGLIDYTTNSSQRGLSQTY